MNLMSVIRRMFKGTVVHRWRLTTKVYSWYTRVLVRHLERTDLGVLVPFRGHEFEIEEHDITILPTLVTGEYEAREIDEFLNVLVPGMTVLDVGANIGLFSVLARQAVGPRGHVYAFEPSQRARGFLERNLRRNVTANLGQGTVTIVPIALADHDGSGVWISGDYLGTARLGNTAEAQDSRGESCTTARLDSLLSGAVVSRTPDVIKVDVEGFEPAVLLGAANLVRERAPLLFIEVSSTASSQVSQSWNAAVDLLADVYTKVEGFVDGTTGESRDVRGTLLRLLNRTRLVNVMLSREVDR